jgi:GTP-binding protein
LRITETRFARAASRPEDEPKASGPEVVFLGRSNVGKSSLINLLLGRRGLARTSSEPGRTQTVNFYRVNESCYFIDLPGYGYAKVPMALRESWKPLVESFLSRHRSHIVLALLVLDLRRGATPLDRMMREWLEAQDIPYLAVATKSDKLGSSERVRAERELAREFEAPVVVSARTGSGQASIWRRLDRALGKGPEERAEA